LSAESRNSVTFLLSKQKDCHFAKLKIDISQVHDADKLGNMVWHKIRKPKIKQINFKAMRPFEINFDFPVASSNLKISLRATAELHHSDPYYLVHEFYLTDNSKDPGRHSVLPDQEVKRIKRGNDHAWVHKDSEKESELSIAIGKGIESVLLVEQLEKDC
jgi:hypothetical protein